ncbi:MAG: DNA/RNA nuclease SfsA [Deltaproteobacteria bacterium]|jgi:sugar fermentation stimulation protein A|nr:DNA/RNA nuclease SfsA [Deltaproteobacteria bacterium]
MADQSMEVTLPWPELVKGVLIKRYKRFLADVEIEGQGIITAHTANTGSMLDCCESGRMVYLSLSQNPKRKYPYGWEMIEMPDGLVGVNTALPNKLSYLALERGALAEFSKPLKVERERKFGLSRLDLKLTLEGGQEVWIEVKNATLVRSGVALFPDAVSQRGARHLGELMALVRAGKRAALLVMVQRSGAESFSPADFIDPAWGQALRQAQERGVEIIARVVDLSLKEAKLGRALEVRL